MQLMIDTLIVYFYFLFQVFYAIYIQLVGAICSEDVGYGNRVFCIRKSEEAIYLEQNCLWRKFISSGRCRESAIINALD